MAPSPTAELSSLSLRLATEDPDRAERIATEARDRAVESGLPGEESTALRALGVAARSRHRIPEAVVHLRAAVAAAERAGDANLAAEARLSLAGALVLAGKGEEAIGTLDGANASGATAVAVQSQRAMVLAMLGHYEEALKAYRQVIPGLRRIGDRVREGRALNNRGALHMYNGRFALAEADMARAERLMLESGNPTEAARYCHNRGSAAALKGDLPTALALFEEADRRCREVGVDPGARALHRATALVAAGLLRESRLVAEQAIGQLREGGNQQDLAEGLLLLADIAMLDGEAAASRVAAEEAATLFENQIRHGWQSLAKAAIARAGLGQGDNHVSLAVLATSAASQLDAMGLADRAVMAHAVAGRLWLAAGDFAAGTGELHRAGSRRRRGTAAGRLAAWEAEGEARLARGDRRGAMAAMRCALAVVSGQQANLAATELRAHVASHAGDAARHGLRLALETGRSACIWQWMERHRANSLRPPPARPPRDEVLAAQLAELRRLGQEIASCATSGNDPGLLLARQSDLERQARERAWQAAGVKGAGDGERPMRLTDVFTALGGAALVELADVEGELHAVVVAAGRCHHRHVAAVADVRRELGHLRLAMRRLAYQGTHLALGAGADDQLARAADRLDRLLMAPLAPLLGSRPVVVVPTGELHATPWAALPTLAGRPVSVAPSARLWLATALGGETGPGSPGSGSPGPGSAGSGSPGPGSAGPRSAGIVPSGSGASLRRRARRSRRRPIVVAGPGLAGAEHEAAAIGSLYSSAHVLTGPGAEVAAVLATLEGAGTAHVAAHASFRADNGLWSSLELADGVLTVYELEQLRRPPEVVVLSACQSGLSAVRPGDEVMGLVAALLTLGTRSVVASVVPVEDRGSEPLMVALHQRLLAGETPAVALAGAQSVTAGTVSLSYVCFGSG
jgi:tetratricopeptide (TPR) repeat protein